MSAAAAERPFSQACENNKAPILSVLRTAFADRRKVLEIGSGTGQHAVYLAANLEHLNWQTSDLEPSHAGIRAWIAATEVSNVLGPVTLDVGEPVWPVSDFDAVFTANTLHIMSWVRVQDLFAGLAHLLPADGVACIYGPFNYRGGFSSASNARFDAWLRSCDPARGIRDFEAVCELAAGAGLALRDDHAMPANNRLLEFRRLR